MSFTAVAPLAERKSPDRAQCDAPLTDSPGSSGALLRGAIALTISLSALGVLVFQAVTAPAQPALLQVADNVRPVRVLTDWNLDRAGLERSGATVGTVRVSNAGALPFTYDVRSDDPALGISAWLPGESGCTSHAGPPAALNPGELAEVCVRVVAQGAVVDPELKVTAVAM